MIAAADLWMLGLRPLRSAAVFDGPHLGGPSQSTGQKVFPDMSLRRAEHLTVGVACSLRWGSGRRILAAFREARPHVDLIVRDLLETDLAEQLDLGGIDVAIAPDNAAQPGWRTQRLCRERLLAALPETSRLSRADSVTPKDLRDETLLLAGDELGHQALHQAFANALGGKPGAVAHHPVERDTLLDLVALGIGFTICPRNMTGAFHPGVCFRPIESGAAEIGYSLMWKSGPTKGPLDLFVALADELAKAAHHGQA